MKFEKKLSWLIWWIFAFSIFLVAFTYENMLVRFPTEDFRLTASLAMVIFAASGSVAIRLTVVPMARTFIPFFAAYFGAVALAQLCIVLAVFAFSPMDVAGRSISAVLSILAILQCIPIGMKIPKAETPTP